MTTNGHRADLARRVAALYAKGYSGLGIAKTLGISRSYTYELLSDPGGAKVRARKASYRGRCEECGGPTDGSAGPNRAPTRCKDCITWTREDALAAVRAFADRTGRPPTEATKGVPSADPAIRLFGGWNEMLLAAGLPLNCDRRASTQEYIEETIRNGATIRQTAESLGWSESRVSERLKSRGLSVYDLDPDRPRLHLPAETVDAMRARRAEGWPLARIAEEFGVSMPTAWRRTQGVLPHNARGKAAA